MTGKLHIYTGNGKGKTTAAVGLAVRAASCNKKVFIAFLDKVPKYCNEAKILSKLPNVRILFAGENRIRKNKKFRLGYKNKDKVKLDEILININNNSIIYKYDILVLDELLNYVKNKIISEKDLINYIKDLRKKNKKMEIILTGRGVTKNLIKYADLVTEMKEIKHYFKKGLVARKGIDY